MDYQLQKEALVNYYKMNAKKPEQFQIGVELEHFIVDKESFRAISYYEEGGIQDILKYLLQHGWHGHYEEDYLLALEKNGSTVTLEPGGQFELSIRPLLSLAEIEQEYLAFLQTVTPYLKERGLAMIALGYQPESSIKDIPFIPKKRYAFMADHFKDKGHYAYNMMRGTSSIHLSFDYASEEDFKKKFRVANSLTTVVSALFDNAPFFEGGLNPAYCQRVAIWNNCDRARCGVVPDALDQDFGYAEYARYLLETPVILLMDGDTPRYTKEQALKEVYNPQEFTPAELEHVLTMVFPDVRAKKYLEIRMADAVPYPLNLSAIALWKGLLYNAENLDRLDAMLRSISNQDISASKDDCLAKGLKATLAGRKILDVAREIVNLAQSGLEAHEQAYLLPLHSLVYQGKSPADITREKLYLGKKEALAWCMLK